MAFDPDAYLKADAPAFDPDAYLAAEKPKEAPSRVATLAKKAGETGADAATSFSTLVSALDPVIAAGGALGSYLVPHTAPEGASFGDRWRNELKTLRKGREEAFRRSPNASMVAAVAPAALNPAALEALPMPFTRGLPTTAPLLTRAASGVADAALINAGTAAATHADERPLGAAASALTSPANLIGAAGPVAQDLGPALSNAGRSVGRGIGRLLPGVKPTEAAKLLRREGVPLTLGQHDPDSFYATFEQASADSPLGMHIEQKAARDAFGDVAINRARPPNAEPVAAGSPQERLAATREAFNEAYAPLKAAPVKPETLAGMPEAAMRPAEGVDARTAAKAADEIGNALTVIKGVKWHPPGMHGGPGHLDASGLEGATAGDLIKVRSNMRDARRAAVAKGDTDLAKALEHGLDTVTGAIEANLSPEQVAQLRATDAQYRRFMSIEDAAAKGGPESSIHPRALASVLPRSYGKAATVEGRAGDLQDLAQAGTRTFDQRVKPTGMRSVLLAGVPKPLAGAGARLLNSPGIKSAILGEGPPPVPAQGMPVILPEAAARALVLAQQQQGPRLRLPGVTLSPAGAEEDRR